MSCHDMFNNTVKHSNTTASLVETILPIYFFPVVIYVSVVMIIGSAIRNSRLLENCVTISFSGF